MLNGKNYITIATDASCSTIGQKHRGTGYAYYLRWDDYVGKNAWYDTRNDNTTEAEFTCLIKALERTLEIHKHEIPPNTILILNIDSDIVARIIDGAFKEQNAVKYAEQTAHINMLLDHFPKWEIRILKSHNFDGSKPNYMNRWCDINARLQLRSCGKAAVKLFIPDPTKSITGNPLNKKYNEFKNKKQPAKRMS